MSHEPELVVISQQFFLSKPIKFVKYSIVMKCLAVLCLFLGLSLALPAFRSSSEAEIERFNGALVGEILSRCILQNGLTRCIENRLQPSDLMNVMSSLPRLKSIVSVCASGSDQLFDCIGNALTTRDVDDMVNELFPSKVETQEKQISSWKSFMKALDGLNLAQSMSTDLCKELYMCKTHG